MAPDTRPGGPHATGRRALEVRPRFQVAAARTCALLAIILLCAFALLAPARSSSAQSGRNRAAQPSPTPGKGVKNSGPIAEPPAQKGKAQAARTTRGPVAPGAPADETRGEEVDEDEVVRVSANLVPLPASVFDAQGHAVSDLELKDFELLVDGESRPIGDLARAETPANIVLLFDNSGSLSAARPFQKAAAARFFRTVMRPVDRAAVYSIETVPELAQRLTNNVEALVRTVEGFGKPLGGTAFFDTIAEAADYLRQTNGRRVLIVVSDGTDTVSELDFDTTLARILATHCQVYAVRVGHSDNANLRDLAGERRLQEFAAQTGGTIYAPRRPEDYEEAFRQIAADLRQQYVLSYYPPGDRRDGRFHAFTLRVTTRPNLSVRTRKGFYAPKS